MDLSKTNELLQAEIAERRRIQDELEFRNLILSTQQDTSIDGILVVDEVATIISYNRHFIELWRIPADMASAKDDMPVLQLVTSQTADPEGFLSRVKYLYEHKEEKSHEEILLKDGRVIDRYSAPMFASNGKYYGRVWYFRDITERKHAELSIMNRTKQLETANTELRQVTQELGGAYEELKIAQSRILQQEKMASIGQLAAGVAHEINNPIGFIMSNLNSLQKYVEKLIKFINIQSAAVEALSLPAGADHIMEDLHEQRKLMKVDYLLEDIDNLLKESMDGAERVKKIVQDLKGFSRIDEAESKMADINQGIESTINIIWNELKYKTTLKKEYGDIPRTICNLGQLNQVFMNILMNAVQAIQTQGEIAVRTWSDNGNICITISDTGMGIPADKLERIFEPFYTTKEVGKGTGLGLSIAYDVLKKHNGEIRVASESGKGTIFTIIVPVVKE